METTLGMGQLGVSHVAGNPFSIHLKSYLKINEIYLGPRPPTPQTPTPTF